MNNYYYLIIIIVDPPLSDAPPKNVAGTTVPALLFQKVLVSYQETRGPRSGVLLLGPPCGQHYLEGCLREGGPNVSKFVQKSTFGANLGVLLAHDFGQNCSKSTLLHFWAPPAGQKHVEGSLRGGGPKCLKICSKKHFLSKSRCVAGPEYWSQLMQIEASSLLGPLLPARNTSKVASGEGGRRAGRCILRRRDSRCVVS